MSRESYEYGFCKVAADYGINPYALAEYSLKSRMQMNKEASGTVLASLLRGLLPTATKGLKLFGKTGKKWAKKFPKSNFYKATNRKLDSTARFVNKHLSPKWERRIGLFGGGALTSGIVSSLFGGDSDDTKGTKEDRELAGGNVPTIINNYGPGFGDSDPYKESYLRKYWGHGYLA